MRRIRHLVPVVCAGLIAASAQALVQAGPTAAASESGTYTNYVTKGYSIDFPDPAVIRGKDGNWYAYATGGPFDETGETGSAYKIAKSTDLVNWTDAGPVFPDGRRPTWATSTTGFWAPDIRYLNGKYLLYFTVPDTTHTSGGWDPAIGVATAPTPAGPWTPSDAPLIPPQLVPGGFDTTIDPAMFTDTDGSHYLYWGGFGTGLYVVKLSPDGLHAVSEPKHIAAARFEGPNILKKDGWYYLFASSANCCAGPSTGYTVFAGRARSPFGPFTDKYGASMLASRAGGTPVVAPNGNRWIGTGHHSAALDLSGATYMAYHAIDRNDPWLDTAPGFTMRPMNLDRMDWIDGWPIVRAGLGASDDEQPAPVSSGEYDNRFSDGTHSFSVVHGKITVEDADQRSDSGRFARLDRALGYTRTLSSRDVRIEADFRTAEGAFPGVRGGGAPAGTAKSSVGVVARDNIRGVLDASKQELRIEAPGMVKRIRIPGGFDYSAWHVLALEIRGRKVTLDVTDARLSDPWASVSVEVSQSSGARAGVIGTGEVDNFSANPLHRPVTRAVPDPALGSLDKVASDEFTDGLSTGWSWLREDDKAVVRNGQLEWPTQTGDLVGDGTPGVLFRDNLPDGDYTVQTKLTQDIGETVDRNYQQGGILVYVNDDDFLRYDVVAVGNTRIVEFGKETVLKGLRTWGGGLIGAPAETTWLRLVHTRDAKTGEHRFRAASSTDGRRWTWGLTWTLPANSNPRIGLVSHGSTPETTQKWGAALSQFDYFRVYR